MKATIDQDLCIGDGICEDICSEVFELRDDGLAYVINDDPEDSLSSKLEEAVRECPTDAIILADQGSAEERAA